VYVFHLKELYHSLFQFRELVIPKAAPRSVFLYPNRQTKGDARNWYQSQFWSTTFFLQSL